MIFMVLSIRCQPYVKVHFGSSGQHSVSARCSVFIPGLPFPGRPGFPAVLIPWIPGNQNAVIPGKNGNE